MNLYLVEVRCRGELMDIPEVMDGDVCKQSNHPVYQKIKQICIKDILHDD